MGGWRAIVRLLNYMVGGCICAVHSFKYACWIRGFSKWCVCVTDTVV
jgi:hypothetical protein